MKKHIIPIFILLFILISCTSPSNNQSESGEPSKKMELKYAKGFEVEYAENYKRVTVYNPFKKGAVMDIYYLVKNDTVNTPATGTKITIPIKRWASTAVTHLEFLEMLGEIESVKGFCNPKLAYNENIRARYAKGEITDLGDAYKLNIEKTISIAPEAVIMSAYNDSDPNAERLRNLSIPVIMNNEWMESTPLGRAEWIKFLATFFNKEELADSIFERVEKHYNELKEIAERAKNSPTVMSGNNFRGTWYMPGGNSFMNRFYTDANANYYYKNESTSGSLPLSIEVVLKNFSKANYWINCNYNTKAELYAADEKYELFSAAKEDKVYNFNRRVLPSGANDFWESAVAHPDLLLGDMIAIFHPELMVDWQPIYSSKLK